MAVQRVEGVTEASFSYDRGEGFVTFDTTKTSAAAIVAELERLTDFSATVRGGGADEHMNMKKGLEPREE